MTSLLLDTELSADQRDYAETIRSSAATLLRIVNDILDFSRIAAGQLPIEPRPFELPAAIREIADLLGPDADARGLTLLTMLAPDLPARVVGDAGRVRQVLRNLLGNAIKFTHQGQITIEASCRERSAAEARILVAIRDTGIGIPADKLDQLFEHFSQADTSSTRRYGGTGLGLAITRRLVELMGGEIGVESEEGVGSTFWFSLPFRTEPPREAPTSESLATPVTEGVAHAPAPAASVPAPAPSAPAPAPAATPARQRRVLLAEDNPVSQRVAARMLEKIGCRVDVATTGQEAVDALARAPYDLVLIDCQMPELDGYAATEAIRRAEPAGRRVPVVGTSMGPADDRERCLAAGMDDCLTRPVTLAALAALAERWLGAAWPERAAAPGNPTAA
jgi:CheY-like chemotaxis protein